MRVKSPLRGIAVAWRLRLGSIAIIAAATGDHASAADVALKLPANAPIVAQYDWSGPYVGFHYGYGGGSFGPDTNPLPLQGVALPFSITGLIAGFQAGFNHQFVNGVV